MICINEKTIYKETVRQIVPYRRGALEMVTAHVGIERVTQSIEQKCLRNGVASYGLMLTGQPMIVIGRRQRNAQAVTHLSI